MTEAQTIEAQIKALTIFNANNTMMSVSECAEYLGVHFNTIKNRIDKETIIAIFQDGKYHIPKLQFVERLIKSFLSKTRNEDVSDEDLFTERLDKYFKEKFVSNH